MVQERKIGSHTGLFKDLKSCCKETSATGFKYTTESNRRCHQICWIIVLIISFGGVFFHCYTLTSTYFSYPKLNSVSHEYIDDEFFPSITICNSQPVSDINYRRHKKTSKVFNEQNDSLTEVQLFSSMSREISEKIGHAFEDMVLYCRFKDSSCTTSMRHWRIHQSARLFNCYTFTPNPIFNDLSSDNMKFSLILYKEPENDNKHRKSYLFSHTLDSGNLMKFTVHVKDEMPDIIFKSVFVQTGIKMSATLTGKIEIEIHD